MIDKGAAILSIGYGNRKMNEVMNLLREYSCRFVADVRSSPYSKFHPEFNRNYMESAVRDAGMAYLFLGDLLGGQPRSENCYHSDGHVNYELLAKEPYFIEGIRQLKAAFNKGFRVALFCCELHPEKCHRSKLIGEVLENEGISVGHIDADNQIVSHKFVILRLTKGQQELFGPSSELSRSRSILRKRNSSD